MKIHILFALLFSCHLYSDHIDILDTLKTTCYRCHGGEKTKGDFDFSKMLKKGIHNEDINQWNKVYRVIKAGDMPPEDEEEFLSIEQEEVILSSLAEKLKTSRNISRLLTADELSNTLADLFGIDLENDNQLETLKGFSGQEGFSTQQQEKSMSIFYINEINRLIDAISKDYILPRETTKVDLQIGKKVDLQLNTVGFASASFVYSGNQFVDLRGQYNDHPTAFRRTDKYSKDLNFKAGHYQLKLKVSSHQRETIKNVPREYNQDNKLLKEPAKLSFYLLPQYNKTRPGSKGKEKFIKSFYLDDHDINEISLDLQLQCDTAIGFTFENGPTAKILKRIFSSNTIYTYDKKNPLKPRNYPFPFLRFHEITLERTQNKYSDYGNLSTKSPSDFIEKTILLTNQLGLNIEETQLEHIYHTQIKKHSNLQLAYLNTLKSILLSSDFLYLNQDPKLKQARYASYAFLKSAPSQEFIQNYRKYKLREITPEIFVSWLTQQPSFQRFTQQFTHEWLELEEINMNLPDQVEFKKFYEDQLQMSFNRESKEFIHHLFKENLSISNLVNSDFSIQNNNLKHYYDKKLSPKSGFQLAVNKTNHLRSGLIFQGAFLSATSNGVEALPFKRAKWISENILDRQIPAPPDNIDVEAFESTEGTFDEKMEAHRNNELCASCHKLIDPLADKMRFFNAIGEYEKHFPQKQIEQNIHEMQTSLLKKKKATATAFCRNLVAYTTGRHCDIEDYQNIQRIVEQSRENNYRARDLLKGVIQTYF